MSSGSTPPPYEQSSTGAEATSASSASAATSAPPISTGFVYATAPSGPPEAPSHFWLGFGIGCGCAVIVSAILAAIAALIIGIATAAIVSNMECEDEAEVETLSSTAAQGSEAQFVAITEALDEGDLERAAELAVVFLRRHPESSDARSLAATIEIEQQLAIDPESNVEAMLTQALEAGIVIRPETQLGVAEATLETGAPERCLAIAERVLAQSKKPTSAEAKYVRGVALVLRGLARSELGDASGAAADLQLAIKLAPDSETEQEWRDYLEEVQLKSQ